MLRIGICDDEREARFTLLYLLERLLDTRAIKAELLEFSSGDRLLGWMESNAGKLDLVFLDIEMEGSDGMETAKLLRAADKNLQLVFVTGFSDYVYDGYSVGALGYLMKPPKSEALGDILARAAAALHIGAEEDYVIKNGDGIFRVPKKSIRWFRSERRVIVCAAEARAYHFYAKLDEVADEAGPAFVRIHQSYLVNAALVERIDGSTVLIGGEELPISRTYQKEAILSLSRQMLKQRGIYG